jgi:hypothetical protein
MTKWEKLEEENRVIILESQPYNNDVKNVVLTIPIPKGTRRRITVNIVNEIEIKEVE